MMRPPLVLLGYGYVAQQLVELVGAGRDVFATSRSDEGLRDLSARGIHAVRAEASGASLAGLPAGAEVVVSFPPDGATDAAWAAQLPRPGALAYVSSTAVYPSQIGHVDDRTQTAPDTDRGRRRLGAEDVWRDVGGVVVRAPAIYGPGRGLLERLRAGTHRLTGSGGGRISRIHVADLAACLVGALERGVPGAAHVVGDELPTTQREIVEFICQAEGLPMPASVEASQASPTLRGDRAVDGSLALAALGVRLRFPTFRDGLAPLLRRAGG